MENIQKPLSYLSFAVHGEQQSTSQTSSATMFTPPRQGTSQEKKYVGKMWSTPQEMLPSQNTHSTLRRINRSPIGSCGEERGDPEPMSRNNVPDSTGCNNSEVSPASSPLVRGSVSQSYDQDSGTHGISSFAMGTERSTYQVG